MEKIVFTNGCFDIIHPGHVDFLRRARELGSRLVVGINSDESIRSIKGPERPIQNENARKAVLEGLRSVDEVLIFNEPTPENVIKQIRPDVLVKGGDWSADEIIGADFVKATGGEVHSLPLVAGHSSSRIVDSIRDASINANADLSSSNSVETSLNEHFRVFSELTGKHLSAIRQCSEIIFDTFRRGRKVLVCGNGGSAADAQHIAAEFVGRYETERRALPSIALSTDTSALTAISNDYGFDRVFARQVDAHAVEGDCLIAISTSGNSPNVIAAVMAARAKGCKVVGLTGKTGTKLAGLCDACVLVPSERTARIQEAHITIAHIWCEIIDLRIGEII